MDIYLVGGAVRDELLGIPVKDRDWVVVGAAPGQMLTQGYRQVGADFPVFLHPDSNEEYALARTERKQGHGYHGFVVHSAPDVTLEEDLQRRDLTINAMARDADGQLVDPFNGRQDLAARQLRHVSPAFAEDPLRILRTARFAARFAPLGFRVAEETTTLMGQMVSEGEVDHLVPERVWQEMQRALQEQAPAVFFEVLHSCGALAVLMPELDASRLAEALDALRCVCAHDTATDVRLAAMLSPLSTDVASQRAKAMKAPNECQDLVRLTTTAAERFATNSAGAGFGAEDLLQLLELADAWRKPERFSRLLVVLRCAQASHLHPTLAALEQAAVDTAQVNAQDLMAQGHKGKTLGQAIRLERLRRIQTLLASSQEAP
ncbi:multifunctional CCA tRNA nucleotidyl transferase/2'3'-cyclic phosphodiesterase/2'nucleotidase/phosphatase [Marinobacter sp. SS21]|uniref:multifunctional CCA tRNA nucleotidyl transferase/2'3'-cyclic phosphodiesterase/2'nucleotidase/phosphatase n=1 Tax=Marinobacter sp. SS21 TaxID=2979460 RepID=UPI00233005AE|nr:multifunctional CCA tRNA nucleotidyl transferase/2'3'-cyclic phosphodiesterase/2'nucleotidase/phosphatase [Marinobacter sp. SS21]MDC0663710.1 multifunctional CCA tRNA nucleotidyl transferase/2'3'-cyclic phosphodiesterase/2'nucleotidase/phosphatase [Marinobacter sp. SS21]